MTPYFQKFLVLCQAYCVVIDVIFTAIARLINKPACADEHFGSKGCATFTSTRHGCFHIGSFSLFRVISPTIPVYCPIEERIVAIYHACILSA